MVVASLLLAPADVQARQATARTVTIESCVAHALEHNTDIRVARLVLEQAGDAKRDATGALLPALRADGSYLHLSPNVPDYELEIPPELGLPLDEGILSIPAIRDRYSFSVSAEQPVFAGGRLLNQRRAASYLADARQADVASAEVDIAYAVRLAFWDLFEAVEASRVTAAAAELVDARLELVVERQQAGAALRSDVLAVQTRAAEVRLEQVAADQRVAVARMRLNELAGFPVDDPVEPAEALPLDWTIQDVTSLEAQALSQQPRLRSLESEYDAARAQVGVARAGWLPMVFLTGSYQYSRPNPYIFPQEDEFTGTWQAGAAARWDVWTWGRTAAASRQARARAEAAGLRVEEERRRTRFRLRERVMQFEYARVAASVAEQAVVESAASYEAMRARFDLGAALTTELLAAELASREAQLRNAAAMSAVGRTQAALWRELGLVRPN